MKIRWRFVLLSLFLVLLLGFAYWNQSFFLTYLISPIAKIFWLIYRTFLSVDQEVYWVLLITASMIVFLRLLPDNKKLSSRSSYRYSNRGNDRVAYWDSRLKSAEESESSLLALQHELEALHRSIEALADGNGEGILLPPFRNHFRQRRRAAWRLPFLAWINQKKESSEGTELELCVSSILQSMEAELEMKHDGKSNRNNED